MNPFEALQEVVKPDLESVFGKSLTSSILVAARSKSGAPLMGINKEQYLALINCICDDPKVKDLWGEAGTKDKLNKWKNSV